MDLCVQLNASESSVLVHPNIEATARYGLDAGAPSFIITVDMCIFRNIKTSLSKSISEGCVFKSRPGHQWGNLSSDHHWEV
ncbi:hypothetical protein NPIL_395071 [Nephila pilipes]|uniref:Uncharacterized protein n=1 Tax=Nephila pilipes TaxID=299642 RepID=A0A8X6TFM2_NEPPI|nr:hypothetical protein NPIL_395071 [Nephila pilipes]